MPDMGGLNGLSVAAPLLCPADEQNPDQPQTAAAAAAAVAAAGVLQGALIGLGGASGAPGQPSHLQALQMRACMGGDGKPPPHKFVPHSPTLTGRAPPCRRAAAGKEVTALLKRNLLDTVTVWWMPGAVVGLTSFALAALWGCVVFAAVALTAGRRKSALFAAAGVGALGGLAAGLVLQLLGRLLMDAVDAVFYVLGAEAPPGPR
ncbi:MAG: hypothetical protein J3K34DRAFT_523762 [Monoraphidium minutum]|nr:MAG: hypothetical protein J3K34DRAFT_523762 [Monoraphidium minutum]